MALTWALAGAMLVGALAALATALTLRGDLAAPVAEAAALGLAVAALARAWVRWRRLAGSRLRTAETVAGSGGSSLPRDLREDLLAAVEIWSMLRGEANARPGHLGSPELAEAFVAGVDARLRAVPADRLLPPWQPRALLPLVIALGVAGFVAATPGVREALPILFEGLDARPEPPTEPLWRALTLELHYPAHSRRPPREVRNPSGSVRVLAGTELRVVLEPEGAPERMAIVVHGPPEDPRGPTVEAMERDADGSYRGAFKVEGPGAWTISATVDGREEVAPALPLTIEPDEAPEVELLPLAAADRAPSELDSVDITFRARDDFGIARAHLVIAADGGEGEETRLDLGAPPDHARAWNHRYAWDLSQMPIEERRALEYWIEVRDNDPARIGADPLPGKVTRSTRMRLEIHDRESEHAANIEGLRELRDAAVDHLAHRLLAAAFAAEPPALLAALDEARSLHAEIGDLLAGLATMIDQLSVDPLTRERDVANLTAIHRRLRAIYLDEAAAHAKMPPGAELGAGGRARTLLASLAAISERLVRQLEDEIIRLDDLVDNQIVDRIEALVARVEASQRKLVELLERLRAGDRTVEPAIEELQQRLREDLRRIAEARAQLHKEVDSEFLNLDAFRALESRLSHEDVMESLRRGDVDGALERARERLEELRGLRDSVQERLANAPSEQLSPQERARLVLLRELSRLQDTERGIEGESRTIHERWRAQVSQQALDDADATALKKRAEGLRESIESINDARLDREARRALDDAAEHLDRLSKTGNALEAQEGAEGLVDALERALAGAREGEREAKQLRRLVADAKEARERTRGRVPTPEATHQGESAAALEELAQRQGNARQRARELLALPEAEHLPEAGEAALERAAKSLDRSAGDLDRRASGEALGGEREALGWIQQAIDSLRKTSPPPSGASAQASTESERDRSLRDSVLEAMRERPPEGYDEPVKRYYEELLR